MPNKYILIVEDDKFQIGIFDHIIKKLNFKTLLLSTGKDALEFLSNKTTIQNISKNEIGLILLDLALPDISGMQILEELKALNNTIPVVALSANEELDTIVKTIKLGADNFFIKGKNEDELRRMCHYIETIMNHSTKN